MNRYQLTLVFSALLLLTSLSSTQALAAPVSEGVLPPLPEQSTSVKIETVTTRQNTTCAIKTDGTLACWGNNNAGKASPPSGTFTQVTLGWYSACGLKTDGTVACWGETANNQNAGFPTGQTFTQISSGEVHTCGIKTDGTLDCWGGFNSLGEITPPLGTYTQVATGWNHACAIKTDGTLACWGAGTTNTGTDPNRGQAIAPSGTFIQVSAGWYNTCGIKTDGSLLCWGDDSANQVSSTPSSGSYIQVSTGESGGNCAINKQGAVTCWGNTFQQGTPPSDTFTQISIDESHVCGLRTDGELICWGDNTDGQSIVPAGNFGRSQISAGSSHTCWLKNDGTIICWGTGIGTIPTGTFTQISAGLGFTCAVKTDGTLACWGNNGSGQSTPPNGTFTQVSTGFSHACGIQTDGTLACWGSNLLGERDPLSGTYIQVSSDYDFNCAVKTDGTLACWGNNVFFLSTPPSGTYTQVSTGNSNACAIKTDGTLACWGNPGAMIDDIPTDTFTQLTLGGNGHACAIKTDGTLACWGNNTDGQATPPSGTFQQVSAGSNHTCGLRTNGDHVCWGANESGQSLPVIISGHTGAPGLVLHFSDDVAKEVSTDSNGDYSFKVSYGWTGIVSPSLDAYPDVTFAPPSRLYTDIVSAQTSQDYAVTLNISGNAGADGATLSYDDGGAQTATADGSGDYTFSVPFDWGGTVTPSKTGVIFTPTNLSFANVTANQTTQDFTATVTISGNAGALGVTLSYTDSGPQTATSDINGNYTFDVPYDWSGTVTPSMSGVSFTPANLNYVNITVHQISQDYLVLSSIMSSGTQDGWVLESSETSNKGGALNKTANLLYVGDNLQDKQYKSFLSFNTDDLPDNATITSVQLKIKIQGFVGGNMFIPKKTLKDLVMDIQPYFGASAGLVLSDFESKIKVGVGSGSVGILTSIPTTGWYTVTLNSAAYSSVNRMGITQFRLRFQKDDNDDMGNDYLKIYSGNAPAVSRPQLIVEYHVP